MMVGSGMLMLLVAALALYLYIKKELYDNGLFLWLLVISIPLPYIANTTGWLLTEISRTPWIVFGLLKLQDAISPTVSFGYVLTSLIVFTLVYTALIVVDLKLMFKFAKEDTVVEVDSVKNIENREGALWI
jgi:cytochrome d ubiquinol oxidase subunit I